MGTPPAPPSPKSALWALALLVAGVLAWALWPQEFRFDRHGPGGKERVAVYSRWGFIVKEVVLEAEGAPSRSRLFPVGEVGLWRIGALQEVPGGWAETTPPRNPADR